jgi:hypothetical protein
MEFDPLFHLQRARDAYRALKEEIMMNRTGLGGYITTESIRRNKSELKKALAKLSGGCVSTYAIVNSVTSA